MTLSESVARQSSLADAPVGWGAAVIDAQGREIPITEAMIRRACDQLSASWVFPRLTDKQAAQAR
jgi:hypothetical protein